MTVGTVAIHDTKGPQPGDACQVPRNTVTVLVGLLHLWDKALARFHTQVSHDDWCFWDRCIWHMLNVRSIHVNVRLVFFGRFGV